MNARLALIARIVLAAVTLAPGPTHSRDRS